MNKRQRKKNYKKKYGYNPPSNKQYKNAFCEKIKDGIKRIQEMPEEEFNKKLKLLTAEQQAMARAMRKEKMKRDV